MTLMIFGLGYTSQHFLATHAGADAKAAATVRDPQRAQALSTPALTVHAFDGRSADAALRATLGTVTHVLVSVPPGEAGDPVLQVLREELARSSTLTHVVYLSTVGVYGDHGGAWIDETTPCNPSNERSRWRLEAEAQWLAFGQETGKNVHVLRLSGIYGPGQNALCNLKSGTARRIIKAGQVFNRIHVADIGRAIAAGFQTSGTHVWNVTDDEPAPPQDVVVYAAKLLGVTPPPEIDFDAAQMSPMARSFYAECKRVRNTAMKERLRVTLAYPTYREALDALYAAGEGR